MPKEVVHINKFVTGTVSVPSPTDTPLDAAFYSLNLDSVTENGKLKGIPKKTKLETNGVWSISDGSYQPIDADKMAMINNNGVRDVVYFEKDALKIHSINDLYDDSAITFSDHGAVVSGNSECAMQVNNKEVHIGLGKNSTDIPKWVGHIPHAQFGGSVPSGLQIENAELESPSSFPDLYNVVNDGTYIYGVEWQGQYVYKFKISDGTFVRKSEYIFSQIQGISIEAGGELWVYDRGVGTYGTLYKCNIDPIQINQTNTLNAGGILDAAEATMISNILEVGTVIWFALYGARVYDDTCVWNVTIPTTSIVITLTPRTPGMGPVADLATGSSNAEGLWVDEVSFANPWINQGREITWTLPKISLLKLDDTDYVGIIGKHTAVTGGLVLAFEYAVGNNTTTVNTTVSVIKNDHTEFFNLTAANNARLYTLDQSFLFDDIDNVQFNSVVGILYGTSSTVKTLKRFAAIVYNSSNGANKTSTDTTTFDVSANGSFTEVSDTWYAFGASSTPYWAKRVYSGSFGAAIAVLQGRVSITLAETAIANSNFTATKIYYYKVCLVYDGYQETPLSDDYAIVSTGKEIEVKINIYEISTLSKRASHVMLFRAEGASGSSVPEGYYRYVKTVELNDTFIAITDTSSDPAWGNYRQYTFIDVSPSQASYEAMTGISEVLDNTLPNYALSAQLNNHHFIGKCYHPDIKDAGNYIFKSKPYKFDQFNWVEDYLRLPSTPVAMVGFNGRLYVWDENNTYRINPDAFYIEDTFEGVGCFGPDAVSVSEYGMCFADKNNIYLHNGTAPVTIGDRILRASDSGYQNKGWLDGVKSNIKVAFDSERKSFIVMFYETTGTTYNAWAYNIPQDRMDAFDMGSVYLGILQGKNGEVLFSNGTNLYNVFGGGVGNPLNWYFMSGKLTFGLDTIKKVFYNVKLESVNLGTAISDPPVGTDNVQVYVDGTLVPLTYANGVFTLPKTSARIGKNIRIYLYNQAGGSEVDAIGIVFRRKSIK